MGWGILFIGYFLAFFVPVPPLALAGLALVAFAIWKLMDYRAEFRAAMYWLIPIAACSLAESLVFASKILPYLGIALPEMPWLK